MAACDRTKEYQLLRSTTSVLDFGSLVGQPIPATHWRDAYDDLSAVERERLWSVKTAFDEVDVHVYTKARDKLFPLDVSGPQGSRHLGNRAGYKLSETMTATGMWLHLNREAHGGAQAAKGKRKKPLSVTFADICGGPGAFSQALFAIAHTHNIRLHGFGMTLANVDGLDWYPHLLSRRDFTVTYGLDGTGDIFKLENLNALQSVSRVYHVKLVVADGGFDIPYSIANYQEAISARIVYGQWLCALRVLADGGCMVLKLFDTFTPFTRSLLYLSTFAFDRVHIVKPKHSRVVNSERYLACLGFQSQAISSTWMEHLLRVFTTGFETDGAVPEVFPDKWVRNDEVFLQTLTEMNEEIAMDQCDALATILACEEVRAALADSVAATRGSASGTCSIDRAGEDPPTEAVA